MDANPHRKYGWLSEMDTNRDDYRRVILTILALNTFHFQRPNRKIIRFDGFSCNHWDLMGCMLAGFNFCFVQILPLSFHQKSKDVCSNSFCVRIN